MWEVFQKNVLDLKTEVCSGRGGQLFCWKTPGNISKDWTPACRAAPHLQRCGQRTPRCKRLWRWLEKAAQVFSYPKFPPLLRTSTGMPLAALVGREGALACCIHTGP